MEWFNLEFMNQFECYEHSVPIPTKRFQQGSSMMSMRQLYQIKKGYLGKEREDEKIY